METATAAAPAKCSEEGRGARGSGLCTHSESQRVKKDKASTGLFGLQKSNKTQGDPLHRATMQVFALALSSHVYTV